MRFYVGWEGDAGYSGYGGYSGGYGGHSGSHGLMDTLAAEDIEMEKADKAVLREALGATSDDMKVNLV